MRVLLVSGDFTTWGGMDRANYELAWHLAEHVGAKVHLVAYFVVEPLASHPNVTWRRVPKPLNRYLLAAPLLTQIGRSEARRVQQQGGHIVLNGGNCQWPGINWVHAAQVAWKHRTEHAPLHFRLRQWMVQRGDRQAEKRALQVAKIVIVNSEQTRTRLIQDLGIPPDRVHNIYYGIDPSVFRPATPEEKLAARERLGWAANTPTAVFVGALGYDRHKGFDILFEAWKQLCADPDWDVDLVAVGGGAEVAQWRTEAERVGLSKRIRMQGFAREVPDIVRASDLMVHPTFYDSYGLGVQEALCSGVPAMVTRSAGVAERYPANLSDLLLDHPPSAANLIASLRRWRAGREEYRTRVLEFSAQLRQRTWGDMAREFVEIAMPSLNNVFVSLVS